MKTRPHLRNLRGKPSAGRGTMAEANNRGKNPIGLRLLPDSGVNRRLGISLRLGCAGLPGSLGPE